MGRPSLSEEVLKEAVEAYSKYGTYNKAAVALGIQQVTLQARVRKAIERGYSQIMIWIISLPKDFPLQAHLPCTIKLPGG